MNFNDILGGLLKSATGSASKKGSSDLGKILNGVLGAVGSAGNQSKSDIGSLLNSVLGATKNTVGQVSSGDTSAITKIGGGAALVGILSMVLGRNGGANLTKLGSLAALGSLAYQAYQHYQRNNATQSSGLAELSESQFVETESSAEQSSLLLRAMIAAAMSDGELDEQETAFLDQESVNNPQAQQALMQEIENPMTPAQIAAEVNGNAALAAQVYLASRMVCQELSRKEVIYLAKLAEALQLDESLVEQLEKQAGF